MEIPMLLNNQSLKGKLEAKYIIGCNRAFEFFRCDTLCVQDNRFLKVYEEALNKFEGNGGIIAPDTKDNAKLLSKIKPLRLKGKGSSYVDHNNCGALALQVALEAGYNKIFMLGMDCRFSTDMRSSHFHSGYNHLWKHAPLCDKEESIKFSHLIWGFEEIGRQIIKRGLDVKVYNCSYVSWVDIDQKYFPRMSVKECILDH